MTTAETLQALRHLPDDAKVTITVEKGDLVRALMAPENAEVFDGIGTPDAAKLLGMPERKARRFHARCERMQMRGLRPPVRVSRKNPANPNSDLLFDREDCLAYGSDEGPGRPELVRESEDANDPAAIAESLLETSS